MQKFACRHHPGRLRSVQSARSPSCVGRPQAESLRKSERVQPHVPGAAQALPENHPAESDRFCLVSPTTFEEAPHSRRAKCIKYDYVTVVTKFHLRFSRLHDEVLGFRRGGSVQFKIEVEARSGRTDTPIARFTSSPYLPLG